MSQKFICTILLILHAFLICGQSTSIGYDIEQIENLYYEYLHKAVELGIDGFYVLYLKSEILYAQGKSNEALQVLKEAKNKVPPGHKDNDFLYRINKTISDWETKK